MGVSDYNTNPDNNTTISGINIAEGCPPSGINNAIRQMMADVKTDKADADADRARLEEAKATRAELTAAQGTLRTELTAAQGTLRTELTAAQGTLRTELTQAIAAHDADPDVHAAMVQRVTVGDMSPIIGIVNVATGGGAGLWANVDGSGQPVNPSPTYFNYHPTYKALRRVLVDGQVMQEHSKFYFKALTIASGPYAGKKAKIICPGQQDGFKPYPSFMKDGQEVDAWYCGAYDASSDGGSPVKLCSLPAKAPFANVNFPTMKGYCTNRNTGGVEGFQMWDIYQASELQLLHLIEFGNPDSQFNCGRGRVDTDSAAVVDATDVAQATWRGHVGLWGNIWKMVDGIDVTTAGKLRLWKNDGSHTFVDTGFTCPAFDRTNVAYMQTFKEGTGEGFDFDEIYFPATTTTNAALGTIPDGFWGRSGSAVNVCYLGARWDLGVRAGLFALNFYLPASYAGTDLGCRLAKV